MFTRLALVIAIASSAAACRPKGPVSPHCSTNSELQFKRITERYDKYRAGTKSPGDVYWARHDLETARFVLTGTGIDGSGAQCTGDDRKTQDFDRLKLELNEAEGHVVWMESDRGVVFDNAENNGVHWKTKDGQPVPQNDANNL